ncbi:unnamed protein product [Protopolystoma xenopodis]|uniref:Uncharacterized protein n=1 Tax=Protopolystoma xenopodis TaxID=117903 RepID=A0A448WTW9_9PLAT|nr:unnamed protein product [Protopolystoma xenopodis]
MYQMKSDSLIRHSEGRYDPRFNTTDSMFRYSSSPTQLSANDRFAKSQERNGLTEFMRPKSAAVMQNQMRNTGEAQRKTRSISQKVDLVSGRGGVGEQRYDARYKILLLGDSGVGKTSLLKSLMNDGFDHHMISTIGKNNLQ